MIDTIVAIATPPGRGGVGVIRVSGPLCNTLAQAVLHKTLTPRVATFTAFFGIDGSTLDEGLAIYFPGPNSFTGEDVLELQGHGSPVVMDMLLNTLVAHGARLAEPGEFSKRAFLNQKMDLTQAEAVADLIDASTEAAARSAMNSLQGEFSLRIHQLVASLIELRMFVEAAIDFPEEEIDFLSEGSVAQKTEHLLQTISNIESLAKQGVLLKEGMKLVILGKPNAGKSSLLNALSGIDAAIVTELPGTTRDVIEQHIQIDGMPVHILDTAGLRETQDIIEQEGIKRALKAIETANQLLVVLDITDLNALSELQTEFASIFNLNIPMTFVHNKIDLTENSTPRTEEANQSIYLSAKTGEGLDLLKTHLLKQMGFQGTAEGQFSARRRHLEAMARAKSHIEQGLKRIRVEKAGELLAEELKQAQNALNEITGEFRSDDLLGKIFSSFCIGK